jgi:hypothetical protein
MTVPQVRKRNADAADPTAREHLRRADPVLRELIDAHPDFRPRTWLNELSPRVAVDPEELRAAGMSHRKAATLRALAERFVDGRLSDESLSRMSDEEVEAALTEVPGIGPWTAHGFLLVALDRPDVLLSGDLALRASGDDADAKAEVTSLFEDSGFSVIDLGGLREGAEIQQFHRPLAGLNLVHLP